MMRGSVTSFPFSEVRQKPDCLGKWYHVVAIGALWQEWETCCRIAHVREDEQDAICSTGIPR